MAEPPSHEQCNRLVDIGIRRSERRRHALDDVAPGAVVVIDNGGRLDATVWGDILTWFASARGIAGTVIDGVSRDYDRAAELSYPIFSRGTYMRTGKDRVQVAAIEI